jgi:hypothetical protein
MRKIIFNLYVILLIATVLLIFGISEFVAPYTFMDAIKDDIVNMPREELYFKILDLQKWGSSVRLLVITFLGITIIYSDLVCILTLKKNTGSD